MAFLPLYGIWMFTFFILALSIFLWRNVRGTLQRIRAVHRWYYYEHTCRYEVVRQGAFVWGCCLPAHHPGDHALTTAQIDRAGFVRRPF